MPKAYQEIDWQKPFKFLDKELLKIHQDNKVTKRLGDTLVEVVKKDGKETWCLVEIEVQGSHEPHFSERIWQYYYRLYDRYQKPLMCMVILADENRNWRPQSYHRDLWGCKLEFSYPIIKLIDYEVKRAWLATQATPVAKIVEMHLESLLSRGNPELILSQRLKLAKKLYNLGCTREEMTTLYDFISYNFPLPPPLEQTFIQEITQFENEVGMHYIETVKQIGRQEGHQEGLQAGECKVIQMLLESKFGPLEPAILKKLEKADIVYLEKLTKRLLLVNSLDELFKN